MTVAACTRITLCSSRSAALSAGANAGRNCCAMMATTACRCWTEPNASTSRNGVTRGSGGRSLARWPTRRHRSPVRVGDRSAERASRATARSTPRCRACTRSSAIASSTPAGPSGPRAAVVRTRAGPRSGRRATRSAAARSAAGPAAARCAPTTPAAGQPLRESPCDQGRIGNEERRGQSDHGHGDARRRVRHVTPPDPARWPRRAGSVAGGAVAGAAQRAHAGRARNLASAGLAQPFHQLARDRRARSRTERPAAARRTAGPEARD